MQKLLLGILAATSLSAQTPRTLVLSSTQYLSFTTPSFVAGSVTYEFRMSGISTPGTTQVIFSDQYFGCSINTSFNMTCGDGPASAQTIMSLLGRTDIRVRVTKNIVLLTLCTEIWNANGGTYAVQIVSDTVTSTSRGAIGGNLLGLLDAPTGGGSLGFWRLYSTSTPVNSMPPAEAPTGFADKGDFRFENSLADSGPAGVVLNLGGGGSVAYADNAIFAPVASISESGFPARALSAKTFTSASFSSLLGNGVPSLFWTQTPITPITGSFSSRTASSTSFTATLSGTYTIKLTATDASGVSSSATTATGIVATDNKGVLVTGLSAIKDYIIGPQLRTGLAPWPYADYALKAVAKELKDAMIAQPPTQAISTGTLLTGTCTLTTSPAKCTRTGGTSYISQGLIVGDRVLIAWDTIDGPGTGRLIDVVYDCLGACPVTSTTFNIATSDIQVTLGSGLSVYKLGPDIHATINGSDALLWAPYLWQTPQPGSFYWPYYSNFLGIEREKFRNGLTEYETDANTLIQYEWQYSTDHARYGGTPRTMNLQSQFLAAIDNPTRFPELLGLVQYFNAAGYGASTFSNIPDINIREMGYVIGAEGLGAITDPDSGRHTTWCGLIDADAALWVSNMNVTGYWPQRPQDYSYAPPYGTSPWLQALAIGQLQIVHDALKDYCSNPTRAASLLTALETATTWTYTYGLGPNRGVYYDVLSPSNGQDITPFTGTVSVSTSSGQTAVIGSGTSFLTTFASPSYIAIECGGGGYCAHLVTVVTDNTHLTISPAWGSQSYETTGSGRIGRRVTPSGTSCAPSLAAYCNGETRDLTSDLAGIFGWSYRRTGNATRKTQGDAIFSATMGGPADGPGGSAAPGGPGADGTITFVTEGLYNCANIASSVSGFCSTNGTAIGPYKPNAQKNFGELAGPNCSQCYLADRLGGLAAADLRTLVVEGNLASIPNATKLRVTITYPDGTATTTTCAATRCAVTADARQAGAVQKVDFLSTSNAVLATGESVTLTAASFQ